MSGRTPSFIVVGLVIIMFLLGSFYMSCSSKNTELRSSLEQFEERIRTLTIRNNDAEKKIESDTARKRELEEEKLNIQRQMEKKDSEINDLNTKLNEKNSELQSMKSDKTVLEEQLKEFKSLNETLASKNSLISQLQEQLNDQRQSNTNELTRLKQEYDSLRNNQASQNNQPRSNANEQSNSFAIPPQRFRPVLPDNSTARSIGALFQEPLNRLNNLTKEVKPQIISAALEAKEKVLNVFGVGSSNSSTTTTSSDQQQAPHQEANQNVPAPPLQQQQPERVDSQNDNSHRLAGDQVQYQQRLQRSLNNSIAHNEPDDEEPIEHENRLPPSNLREQDNFGNANQRNLLPAGEKDEQKNYRIGNRDQFRRVKNNVQQDQRIDNGGEMDDEDEDIKNNNNLNDNDEERGVQKRHVL